MDELRKQSVMADIAAGHCILGTTPLPSDLCSVVREWRRLAWFTVKGSDMQFIHNIWVKPGDPATDVLFALAVHCLHSQLLVSMGDAGLNQSVQVRGLVCFQMGVHLHDWSWELQR